MKILDIVQASNKIVFAQMKYSRGFEDGINHEAKGKNIDIIMLSAANIENLIQKEDYKDSQTWIINDFERLTKEKQVTLFNDLSQKIKENKDLKIIVPFNDFGELSEEVCKKSMLLFNPSFLPPIGCKIDFSGIPKVDLVEVRRKFTAKESANGGNPCPLDMQGKKYNN